MGTYDRESNLSSFTKYLPSSVATKSGAHFSFYISEFFNIIRRKAIM